MFSRFDGAIPIAVATPATKDTPAMPTPTSGFASNSAVESEHNNNRRMSAARRCGAWQGRSKVPPTSPNTLPPTPTAAACRCAQIRIVNQNRVSQSRTILAYRAKMPQVLAAYLLGNCIQHCAMHLQQLSGIVPDHGNTKPPSDQHSESTNSVRLCTALTATSTCCLIDARVRRAPLVRRHYELLLSHRYQVHLPTIAAIVLASVRPTFWSVALSATYHQHVRLRQGVTLCKCAEGPFAE